MERALLLFLLVFLNELERFYYVISLHNNKTSGIYTRTESKEFSVGENANRALRENLQIVEEKIRGYLLLTIYLLYLYGEIVKGFFFFSMIFL